MATWSELRARLTHDRAISAGLATGVVGLIVSFGGRQLLAGPAWGDPLILGLSFSQITRGFLYFNWQGLIIHLLFAIGLGVGATAVFTLIKRETFTSDQARQAGQIAAIMNVGLVALLEVDAVIVGFWYVMSGLLSLLITRFVAGKTADFQQRFRPH